MAKLIYHLQKRLMPLALLAVLLPSVACQSSAKKSPDLVSSTLQSVDGEEVIPERYNTIYIYPFSSPAANSLVALRLQEKVSQAFSLDSHLKTEGDPEKADVWLKGQIEGIADLPLSYDEFGRPDRYQKVCLARVSLQVNPSRQRKNGSQSALLLDRRSVRYDSYFQSNGNSSESEFLAIENLLDGLSRRIVAVSLEGWYSHLKNSMELNFQNQPPPAAGNQPLINRDLPREQREKKQP